jgi:hypothetical protein
MVQIRNLKSKRSERGRERGRYLLREDEEEEECVSHLLLKCPEMQRWGDELLNNKWPHISEEIELRKTLTVKNATGQRNLVTLAYEIKCKWEKQDEERSSEVGWRGKTRLYVGLTGYK